MHAPRTGLIFTLGAIAASLIVAGCGPHASIGSDRGAAGGEALVGGPFQLVDQDGKPADQSRLAGKWSAVFFGYTSCPDVCPTTLQALAQAQTKLGARARDLQVVFISVDPDRDTPAQVKAYLAAPAFPQPTLGLTGSPAQVAAVAKAYRVFYQKAGEGEAYSVSHSSVIYLMNPLGRFDRVLTESQTPTQIADQIRDAMASGPKAPA